MFNNCNGEKADDREGLPRPSVRTVHRARLLLLWTEGNKSDTHVSLLSIAGRKAAR